MNGMPLEILVKMYRCWYNCRFDFIPKDDADWPNSNLLFQGIIDTYSGNFFVFKDQAGDDIWFTTSKSFEEWGLQKRE